MKGSSWMAVFLAVAFVLLIWIGGLFARADDEAYLGGAFYTDNGCIIEVIEVDSERGFMWLSDPDGNVITGRVYGGDKKSAADTMWELVEVSEEWEKRVYGEAT